MEQKKYNLNKNQEYYKQQYSCSSTKCNYTTTASIEQYIEKNCNYNKEIRQKELELEYIEHISHEKKAEIIQKEIGTKIPRQTIQYHEFEKSEIFIENEEKTIQNEIKKRNITSSGIIHYDEEFFTKNKEKYVRLSLLDSKTRLILNDQIILQNQFDIDFIEIFLKILPRKPKKKNTNYRWTHSISRYYTKIKLKTTKMHLPQNPKPKNTRLEKDS